MVDRWQPGERCVPACWGGSRRKAAQLRPPPRDPPSHQARQTAALLTAAAYGPINAWYSRLLDHRPGALVAGARARASWWAYGGPRLPLRLLRRGRSQSMVQVPGSDVAIDGACKCPR